MSRSCLSSPIGDKIISCYMNNLIPWLDYNPVTEEIIIKREIIYDLKQFYRINSLQMLAETVNWSYSKQYWIKKSAKNISCVHVKLKEFSEFLTATHSQEIQTLSNPCLN